MLSKGIGAVQVKCSGTIVFVVTVKLEFFDLGPLEHTSGFEPSNAPLAFPHDTFSHDEIGEVNSRILSCLSDSHASVRSLHMGMSVQARR